MIVIVIPAKGRSTRLPNKNMAMINGRPMLDYTIDAAVGSRHADRVYVSTDDDAIEAHAKARGLNVIRRPVTLGGETPIIEVYRHAVSQIPDGVDVRVVVGLQPDHPDRTVDIDMTIDRLQAEEADRVMSTEADGTKNGAHYVLSRHFLSTGESRKDVVIVDDCTNIHHPADLEIAATRLRSRASDPEKTR